MDRRKTGLMVLARFPDLNEADPHAGDDKAKGLGLLASGSRLFGQAASIKLLAGMTLFLLVGAVLPFCIGIGKNPPPANLSAANSLPAGDSLSTWQPRGDAAALEPTTVAPAAAAPTTVASAEPDTVALTVARRPVAPASATAEQSPTPAAVGPTTENKREPQTASTVADAGMSSWQPPAEANQQLGANGVNASADPSRPMARSTERVADARAGQQPGAAPVAAKFEGNTEEPGVRNRYDSTRPSIH
jgi:hypothetical protein